MFHHHRLLRTQSLVVATLLATALLIGSLWLQQVRLRQRLGGLATVKYDDDEIQTVHRGMDGVSVDYQAAPSTASMADEIGEDYIEAARVDANVDTGDSADDDEDDFRNRYDRLAASATNDDPFDGSMTATALQPHSPFAYLTLLSSDEFLLGTVVLVESLLLTGTPNDIIVMVLPHISGHTRNTLAQMGGVLVVEVDYIENPSPEAMMAASRQRWNFSKLRAWQMIEYEKLILLDSDMVVLRSVDALFELDAELAAVINFDSPFAFGDNVKRLFNSGLMLIRPSLDTFQRMLESFEFIVPYNGGDQGFLNEFYADNWVELPNTFNANKMIYKYAQEEFPALEDVKVLHYVRKKPWYDIIQQYENHHTETLFDTPEDYGALNRYWLEIHAHLNMRMAAEMDLLQTRDALQQHCVPYWRRPRGAASDKFCVGILPHFCPFEFTRNCQTHQAVEWSEDLTLATQLSFDRFDRLLELSKEWEGPISAAIWFPEDQWAEVVRTITLSTLPLRRVAVHLVVQSASEPFPINVLRNVAINNTLTDMVFSLDVDFMPSPFLYRRLMNKRRLRMWESTKSKHAFIVPAFEFSRPQPCVLLPQLQKDYGDTSCFVLPMSRDTMVEHLVNGSADPFHPFGKGHRATNTKRWMNATRPYYIEWESWYEPYFVARRTQFDAASHAWFDERFYDRSHNKIVGTFEMHVRGWRFVVLPDSFTIHRWEDPDFVPIHQRPRMPGHGALFDAIETSQRAQYDCTPAVGDIQGTCADKTPTFKNYEPWEPIRMTEEEAEESMLVSSFKHEDNEDEFAGRGVGDEINEEQSVDDISMDSMEDEGTSEEDGAQDVDTGEHIE